MSRRSRLEDAITMGKPSLCDDTYNRLRSILEMGFSRLFGQVAGSVAGLRTSFDHSWNDAYPFRGVAEYFVSNDVIVVVSFDVRRISGAMEILGDIMLEGGLSLTEILNLRVEDGPNRDGRLIAAAHEFASACMDRADLIVQKLG